MPDRTSHEGVERGGWRHLHNSNTLPQPAIKPEAIIRHRQTIVLPHSNTPFTRIRLRIQKFVFLLRNKRVKSFSDCIFFDQWFILKHSFLFLTFFYYSYYFRTIDVNHVYFHFPLLCLRLCADLWRRFYDVLGLGTVAFWDIYVFWNKKFERKYLSQFSRW